MCTSNHYSLFSYCLLMPSHSLFHRQQFRFQCNILLCILCICMQSICMCVRETVMYVCILCTHERHYRVSLQLHGKKINVVVFESHMDEIENEWSAFSVHSGYTYMQHFSIQLQYIVVLFRFISIKENK